MIFTATPLKGNYIVEPEPFTDKRGWFARIYCENEFAAIGHTKKWVQINHSFTVQAGSVRGLHYQLPPHGEIKLVRCIAGAVYDVVIDLRRHSATFLQWFGVELSAQNKKMMYIPEGFAHGFQTLTSDCELIYHHSNFYNPAAEKGILFNDPVAGIKWPVASTEISDKDQQLPPLDAGFEGI